MHKKRLTIMAVTLSLVFGGIVGFNLLKTLMIKRFFANYQAPAVSVSSVRATQETWKPTLEAVGSFAAINGVEVSSEAAGNVTQIHFKSGQHVTAGAPLIDIDDQIDQATLQFNQAEWALQKLNYKRQVDLFKKGATPGSNVDDAKARLQQAAANVTKVEAQIAQKHILAPFSGQLGIRQINLGQFISPGQTQIVTLQSLDPLHLNFMLPEQMRPQLKLHQPITFVVEQSGNLQFTGEITAINAKSDDDTHNIRLQATLSNCPLAAMKNPKQSSLVQTQQPSQQKRLNVLCNAETNRKQKINSFNFIPGMFAKIDIEQPAINNAVVLPTTAISFSLYGNSVFIIDEDKDDNNEVILRVKRVFVKTGDQKGNRTVIESGIKAGQLVVNSGELKLQNNTRVTINNSVSLDNTPSSQLKND